MRTRKGADLGESKGREHLERVGEEETEEVKRIWEAIGEQN